MMKVGAGLAIIEPAIVRGALEAFLDRPAQTGGAGELDWLLLQRVAWTISLSILSLVFSEDSTVEWCGLILRHFLNVVR
jgi:hypothetical protein